MNELDRKLTSDKVKAVELCIYIPGEMNLQNTVQSNGLCAYSNETVEDCLARLHGAVCIPLENALEQIGKAEDAAYINDWEEITQETYDRMLGVLPPEKWTTADGVNIFRIMEYTTGNITAHYAHYKGRYFTANRRTSTDYKQLAKEVKAVS